MNPLTAADLLQVGYWFQREERLFQITGWDAAQPLCVQARADEGTVQEFTLSELFAPLPPTRFAATQEALVSPSDSSPSAARIADAATLPSHLLQRADHIIQVVEHVQKQLEEETRHHRLALEPFSLTNLTRRACASLPFPISLPNYYRYRKLCQEHHANRAFIATALHRNTFGKTQIDPNAQHFIDTLIRRFYRSNPPLRAQTVYAMAQQLWQHNCHWWLNLQQMGQTNGDMLVERLLNAREPIADLLANPEHMARLVQIQLPSRSWFYGYVRWFTAQPGEGSQTYITRHGQADWDANFLLFDRFAQTATLPLQYVFADHYKLDVLCVDDEFRQVLGRLWLTVLIDAYSRAILGLWLAYEDPNIESIQGALRHAIWPKTGPSTGSGQGLAEFGIELPWTCFGIPQRLFLDNAWAHQSYSLEELARTLADGGRYTALELVFRPPYQARYGGLVERLFGNLSGQLRERLPGAILHPSQRHWHNASQGACLLYRDVLRIVHQLVVDYLHTPHRELKGVTPHDQWLAGLKRMTPVPPPFTPQLERAFWRLFPDTRLATAKGLALFGLHYWDVGLGGLRHPDRQGRPRHFALRYEPSDVSRVAVFEQGLWLGDAYARELRLPDGHYEAASLWELELAKDLARPAGASRLAHPHSWLVHLLETKALVEQRQAEQKVIRRKVQQLRERRKGRPVSTSRLVVDAAQLAQTQAAMAEPPVLHRDPRMHLLESLKEVL